MRSRAAFTLIELLVIIGIMAAMVTVSIVSVRSGQGAARVKGATRDIFALIRHARSAALVTQQPIIITYSTCEEDGEVMAKVEIVSSQIMSTDHSTAEIQTLSGEPLKGKGKAPVIIDGEGSEEFEDSPALAGSGASAKDGKSSGGSSGKGGTTVEEILFSPISTDVVRGMRIKVVMGDDEPDWNLGVEKRPTRIRASSNVDYLIGRYKEAKMSNLNESKADNPADSSSASAPQLDQEEVSVVWEVNGRVDPHQVWIYPDGSSPEKGLSIRIDRFGAAKVYAAGEHE